MQLVADFPNFLGAHLHPSRPAENDDGGIGGMQAGDDLAEVVEITRGVDEIDLGVQPLGVADGQIDGVFAFDFVGRIVGERRTGFDGTVASAGAAYEGQGIYQGRLSTSPVPDKRHVSYGVGAIDLHGLHLLGKVYFQGGGGMDRCQMGVVACRETRVASREDRLFVTANSQVSSSGLTTFVSRLATDDYF